MPAFLKRNTDGTATTIPADAVVRVAVGRNLDQMPSWHLDVVTRSGVATTSIRSRAVATAAEAEAALRAVVASCGVVDIDVLVFDPTPQMGSSVPGWRVLIGRDYYGLLTAVPVRVVARGRVDEDGDGCDGWVAYFDTALDDHLVSPVCPTEAAAEQVLRAAFALAGPIIDLDVLCRDPSGVPAPAGTLPRVLVLRDYCDRPTAVQFAAIVNIETIDLRDIADGTTPADTLMYHLHVVQNDEDDMVFGCFSTPDAAERALYAVYAAPGPVVDLHTIVEAQGGKAVI